MMSTLIIDLTRLSAACTFFPVGLIGLNWAQCRSLEVNWLKFGNLSSSTRLGVGKNYRNANKIWHWNGGIYKGNGRAGFEFRTVVFAIAKKGIRKHFSAPKKSANINRSIIINCPTFPLSPVCGRQSWQLENSFFIHKLVNVRLR